MVTKYGEEEFQQMRDDGLVRERPNPSNPRAKQYYDCEEEEKKTVDHSKEGKLTGKKAIDNDEEFKALQDAMGKVKVRDQLSKGALEPTADAATTTAPTTMTTTTTTTLTTTRTATTPTTTTTTTVTTTMTTTTAWQARSWTSAWRPTTRATRRLLVSSLQPVAVGAAVAAGAGVDRIGRAPPCWTTSATSRRSRRPT